eukprot:6475732-Alexandrium_andersonii.AAC.1
MSASLVGSEMCIRDRCCAVRKTVLYLLRHSSDPDLSLRDVLSLLDSQEQDATRTLQAELEAERAANNLPVFVTLGDLRREGSQQAAVRVDDRTGHAAEDAPEATAVHISWQPEARSAIDAAWIPTICHQLRILGDRWDTLLEGRLVSEWEVEFRTATPYAAERLSTILKNTGLRFPGGVPLALK